MSNPIVQFAYFEDHEENKTFFKNSKDAIIDMQYPAYCLTNNAGYKFARVLFCTYPTAVINNYNIHIHETFLVNLFNTSKAKASLNSSIQVNMEAVSENGRVISGTANATCTSYKSNNLGIADTNHKVIVTEEPYTDSTGETRYGIGVWMNIGDYSAIAVNPIFSMSANCAPIHKGHFNAFYVTEYLSDENKINETNMKNIESEIVANQITLGVYSEDYINTKIDNFEVSLNKVPSEYDQNAIYYSNTYTPASIGLAEVIPPFSIRGISNTKIVSLDSINNSFSVLKNGYYAIQVHNGFYTTKGSTQLELEVYKNDDRVKELNIYSYLTENQRNTNVSNVAILELKPSDNIILKAIWDNIDITMDHDTFITIYPVKFN